MHSGRRRFVERPSVILAQLSRRAISAAFESETFDAVSLESPG